MKATTPPGDPGTDIRNDPEAIAASHGDVDPDGEIMDVLDERLRSAIVADSPDLAEAQLRGVKRMLRPWTVRP